MSHARPIEKNKKTLLSHAKLIQKKFWSYIKSKSKTFNNIGEIKTNESGHDKIIDNDEEKANKFVKYFSSVFTLETNSEYTQMDKLLILEDMSDLMITEEMVLEKLIKLKIDKSPGPDNIHPRVLYEISKELAYPLSLLFKSSLKLGKLPEEWQTSVVSAIHKKGSKSDVSNYRPVSLTCIACKIMESVIRDHITQHFIVNRLFANKQYGFIKGRSTTLQLLSILDNWTTLLEEGGYIDTIYTDFEKAFDKVPHKRLISKLKAYGINIELINWIQNFLCFRKHRVRINGKYSEWQLVMSGIPQGSVLGPLLFVIYINDLPNICENEVNMYLFADDAKIFKYIKNENDVLLQEACNRIQDWSDKWLLKLNVNKCMVLSLNRDDRIHAFKYKLKSKTDLIELGSVNTMKDLGVLVDSELSFREHIAEKINKANSMLGIIKRNFRHMNKDTFCMLYKSLVRSHLEYASSVWSPYKKYLIKDIKGVQRRATKLVEGCKNMSYRDRLIYLSLPTLVYRRHRGDMIEVFKILNEKYDPDTAPKLNLSKNISTRGNSLKLQIERTKYDRRKFSFCTRAASVWNSLSEEVIQANTLNSFKNRLDKFWFNQYVLYNWKSKLTGIGRD